MDTDVLGTIIATLIKAESIVSQSFLAEIDGNEDEEIAVCNSVSDLIERLAKKPRFVVEPNIIQLTKPSRFDTKLINNVVADNKRKAVKPIEPKIPKHFLSDFRIQFKMTPSTFKSIITIISPYLAKDRKIGRPSIPLINQLLAVVWMLVNPEPFRVIGERFSLSKATIEGCFKRVIRLLEKMSSDLITWPQGPDAIETVKGFEEMSGLSNVIGAIDNMHFNIKSSRTLPNIYINKNELTTVILQATCNHKMIFTSCDSKSPGSFTTRKVLENSELSDFITDNRNMLTNGEFLVGSSNYPLRSWLIKPFEGDILTVEQEHLNNALAEVHYTIVRALKLLQVRFKRLSKLEMGRLDLIPVCVKAACVLHNICIQNDDYVDITDAADEYNIMDYTCDTDVKGFERRVEIANQLFNLQNE